MNNVTIFLLLIIFALVALPYLPMLEEISPSNLVKNGGFEDKYKEWVWRDALVVETTKGILVETSEPYSGKYCAKLQGRRTSIGQANIEVEPYSYYILSFAKKSEREFSVIFKSRITLFSERIPPSKTWQICNFKVFTGSRNTTVTESEIIFSNPSAKFDYNIIFLDEIKLYALS